MVTLRTLAKTFSGLYCEIASGQVRPQDELEATLSAEVLDEPLRIDKSADGEYRLFRQQEPYPAWIILSRRRRSRG